MDNNLFAYLQTTILGALEQKWAAHLARFKLQIHYQPGKLNTNALSWFLVVHQGEDMDSNREVVEVAPVLPMPAILCTIEEQDRDPPTEAAELYRSVSER